LLTEGQLFERAARCFGPQEPDHNSLGSNPAAVDKQILPADCLGADGVDVGAEELGSLPPELEDGNAAGALCVWEDLNEVSYSSR